ncbi:glycosyltransferase [Nocardioides sp. InS609-2]|uniref:glycosyltransferase n=1 Tax=Nocardioides sp. InS609-2 TaxID=2760705 RepID=UPI0020C072CD|nr:glycosyltransferase [Nocardioides sp. InS609-2]
MSRVLLVSHEASRTGAPRIAALVAHCLVEQGHDVRVVSQRPGPLLPDFAHVAPTRVEPLWRVRRRLWSRPGRFRDPVARLLELTVALVTVLMARPDIVYVNSSSAAAYVRVGRLLGHPVVLHVHESGEVLGGFLGRVGIRGLPAPDVLLVACSPSVEGDLLDAGAADVHLLLSIPDEHLIRRLTAGPAEARDGHEVVVGSCGAVEHRKGVDLWLRAARSAIAGEGGARLRFVWVGDGDPPVEAAGQPQVEFAGASANPYAAMRGFDIMTLPSRDDPFPLVVMEAMMLAKPVVAFDVGGVAHQLGDTGVLVEAGDVEAFARSVGDLAADPARRASLGRAARRRAEQLFSRAAFTAGLTAVIRQAPLGGRQRLRHDPSGGPA